MNKTAVRPKQKSLECAETWDGNAKLPEPFDASPNSGVVIVSSRSEASLVVDFLSSMHGIGNAELLKERVRVCYKNAVFFVIHPLHCLKSRVLNVTGLCRNDSHSLNRLMLAIAVMNRRITHLFDKRRPRQSLKEIKAVFRITRDSMAGIPLFADYGIDISEAVPEDSYENIAPNGLIFFKIYCSGEASQGGRQKSLPRAEKTPHMDMKYTQN